MSDVVFYSVASWFFLLGIMRYYRLPTAVCIAVATLLSLALGVCVFLAISRSHRLKRLGKKERDEKEALMLHLALEKSERVRADLLSAFLADGRDGRLEGDALNLDGTSAVPLFTMQPVTADAVAVLLREYGEIPFLLLCNALTPEAESLLSSFGRKAIRGDEIYSLLKRTDTVPENLICGEIPRKTIRTKLVRAFSKKNARPFFVSGLLLLFMSLFTFFPVYYLVTGSILLSSSVLIRALGYA
ncbi:MAG: hypothetical protein K2H43_03110 [Clostridia bacterium]|nr:hypothetical protein [Clostridia bacterium]